MADEITELFASTLLIEDDAGHAMLVSRAMKGLVREITQASSLGEALAKLTTQSFELIVSDLNLPDARDLEIVERIRSAQPATPMFVLTSSTSVASAVGAMKLGASDFVVKNFGPDFRDVFQLSMKRIAAAISADRERQRLQREMAILRLAIENGNDGVAILNASGEILYSNTAFNTFVEKWKGTITHLATLISPEIVKHASVQENLLEKLKSLGDMSVWTTELTLRDDPNTAFELSLSLLPAFGATDSRDSRSGVIWLRDKSEEKRREKFQREILSTTTHDLKGPLGAIILSADLIQGSVANPSKVEQLALRIGSSAQGAVNLIDEFLSARRIQEGTFILKPVEQALRPVIEEAVQNFTSMASAKNIHVEVAEAAESLRGTFDKLAIMRVLGNLLSNAIKFTPKGGSVRIEAYSADGDLTVRVQDTGSGMEPSEVTRIFERFSRLSKHSDIAGTGLGLFVVKSIVAAHGGHIEVTSKVGEGTTFEISLPAQPPVNDKGELINLAFT